MKTKKSTIIWFEVQDSQQIWLRLQANIKARYRQEKMKTVMKRRKTR